MVFQWYTFRMFIPQKIAANVNRSNCCDFIISLRTTFDAKWFSSFKSKLSVVYYQRTAFELQAPQAIYPSPPSRSARVKCHKNTCHFKQNHFSFFERDKLTFEIWKTERKRVPEIVVTYCVFVFNLVDSSWQCVKIDVCSHVLRSM